MFVCIRVKECCLFASGLRKVCLHHGEGMLFVWVRVKECCLHQCKGMFVCILVKECLFACVRVSKWGFTTSRSWAESVCLLSASRDGAIERQWSG